MIAAAMASLCAAAQTQTREPPQTPILRVEPGMHVNVVRGVAVDAAGRWAVTASDDRTARVWQVATGAAGPVLRVPLAEGAQGGEGRLQAVAITPDGNTVAVAGRSGSTWGGNNVIYVFDRASGRMQRRIDTGSALPVVTLALTPDGRYLAAGLGDEGGLRVFNFASGALLHHDPQYAASIYALDFRADSGVLVAGAADGVLRVYLVEGGRLRQAGKLKLEAGSLITQARFSPDGELIAVGLEDSPVVLVLDGRTLKVMAHPAPAADGASAFSSLAWSPDGSELWGGGTHRSGGQWLLRVWPRADWSRFADRPVSGASVLALSTLPGQRVLFVSGEPAWGIVDAAAQVQRRVLSPLASFNGMARQLQVSADGRKLRYWYGFREPTFEFDLSTRAIRQVDDAGTGLQAARTEAPGLSIEGWENRRGPGFNGRRLPLGEYETSRSLAIAPDGQRWVLGTDERLWMFDAAGKTIWNQRVPSLVWAVNLSADGKLVLAAGQDGTVRWYRASDGAELLAMLPHADRRRWVMWTPSGYFDAAPGAEELLGWHVNRDTKTAPDFFPMSTLRERFRRPDVVDRVLQTADEAVAVQQAQAAGGRPNEAGAALQEALPPVLEINGAPEVITAAGGNANEARLRLRIRTLAQAPVTGLRARADGRPAVIETTVSPTRSATAQSTEERTVTVRFSGRPQQLQLLAENRYGLSSAVTVQMQWPVAASAPAAPAPVPPAPVVYVSVAVPTASTALLPAAPAAAAVAAAVAVATPPPAAAAATIERAPRLFVLAVGVGKFKSSAISPLDLPAKDARDFSNAMKSQHGKLYRSVEIKLLTDEQATRGAVLAGMDWLQREVTQHDVGMFFVAGHGANEATMGYMFIPHDFDPQNARTTTVTHKEFKAATENVAGKALFFIDTCHSGNVLGGRTRSLTMPDISTVINDLASVESGVVVFSASTGRQEALENPAWGNGAFTKSLVEGLMGKADERKTGRVTHKMLDYYVTDRVKELTAGKQSAVTLSPKGVPDFPLAVLR